jgi:hypothetical protein
VENLFECLQLPEVVSIVKQIQVAEDGDTAKNDSRTEADELEESFFEITHAITCLYRLSITIQNPARRDRLKRCASINVSHYEPWDVGHVSNKFPNAEEYLVHRLGKANTSRRQILKYYELYHKKIAIKNADPPIITTTDPKSPAPGATVGREKDPPIVLQIQVVQERPGSPLNTISGHNITVSTSLAKEQGPTDARSDTNISQTSYATSAGGALHRLRVPLPSNWDRTPSGDAFECPYCFIILSVTGELSWRYALQIQEPPNHDGRTC